MRRKVLILLACGAAAAAVSLTASAQQNAAVTYRPSAAALKHMSAAQAAAIQQPTKLNVKPAAAQQPAAQSSNQPSNPSSAISAARRARLAAAAAAAQQQAPPAGAATPPPRSPPSTAPGPAGTQPLQLDWTAVSVQQRSPVNERGRAVNGRFIAANRGAINRIAIPVLLPGDPDLAAGLRIFPNGAFYTVSSTSNGMSFVLTGAGRTYPLPPATARGLKGGLQSRIPADGIVIEQTEGGLDASFIRFGAAYSIALECANTLGDPRCTDPAYVRQVIARLMVVTPGAA